MPEDSCKTRQDARFVGARVALEATPLSSGKSGPTNSPQTGITRLLKYPSHNARHPGTVSMPCEDSSFVDPCRLNVLRCRLSCRHGGLLCLRGACLSASKLLAKLIVKETQADILAATVLGTTGQHSAVSVHRRRPPTARTTGKKEVRSLSSIEDEAWQNVLVAAIAAKSILGKMNRCRHVLVLEPNLAAEKPGCSPY